MSSDIIEEMKSLTENLKKYKSFNYDSKAIYKLNKGIKSLDSSIDLIIENSLTPEHKVDPKKLNFLKNQIDNIKKLKIKNKPQLNYVVSVLNTLSNINDVDLDQLRDDVDTSFTLYTTQHNQEMNKPIQSTPVVSSSSTGSSVPPTPPTPPTPPSTPPTPTHTSCSLKVEQYDNLKKEKIIVNKQVKKILPTDTEKDNKIKILNEELKKKITKDYNISNKNYDKCIRKLINDLKDILIQIQDKKIGSPLLTDTDPDIKALNDKIDTLFTNANITDAIEQKKYRDEANKLIPKPSPPPPVKVDFNKLKEIIILKIKIEKKKVAGADEISDSEIINWKKDIDSLLNNPTIKDQYTIDSDAAVKTITAIAVKLKEKDEKKTFGKKDNDPDIKKLNEDITNILKTANISNNQKFYKDQADKLNKAIAIPPTPGGTRKRIKITKKKLNKKLNKKSTKKNKHL